MSKILKNGYLVLALSFCSLLFLALVDQVVSIIQLSKELDALAKGKILIDLYYEENPLALSNSQETIYNFEDLYNALSEDEGSTYYVINRQPLYQESDQGDIQELGGLFASYYEGEPLEASCVQISHNVQDDFSFAISSGRLLQDEDFHYSLGESVPVLLGASFAPYYSPGDSFYAEYLYSTFQFTIVGILEESTEIQFPNTTYYLDSSIVMPSFSFSEIVETAENYVTMKIHMANKLCGKIITSEDNFDSVLSKINAALDTSKVGKYSYYTSSIKEGMKQLGLPLVPFLVCVTIPCISFWVFLLICFIKNTTVSKQYNIWKAAVGVIINMLLAEVLTYYVFLIKLSYVRIGLWSFFGACVQILAIVFLSKRKGGENRLTYLTYNDSSS